MGENKGDVLDNVTKKLVSYEQVISLLRAFCDGLSRTDAHCYLKPMRKNIRHQICQATLPAYSDKGLVPEMFPEPDDDDYFSVCFLTDVYINSQAISEAAHLVKIGEPPDEKTAKSLTPDLADGLRKALRAANDYAADLGEKLHRFNEQPLPEGEDEDDGSDEGGVRQNSKSSSVRPQSALFKYPH